MTVPLVLPKFPHSIAHKSQSMQWARPAAKGMDVSRPLMWALTGVTVESLFQDHLSRGLKDIMFKGMSEPQKLP